MKIKCTLKQLYDYNESHNHSLDGNVKVNGRHGFNTMNTVAITATNSRQIRITTRSGKEIICSPDHLLFTTEWTKVCELSTSDYLETADGSEKIIMITELQKKTDLYDLDIQDVHEFYANGIVSHNSAISNLIVYMLYGQIDGFTQKDIPNRINKHFEGEITFEANKHNVTIYRALAPNAFKVVVDGESVDTAGKNNVQKWLEDEIYRMGYSVFKNAIVLSVNDFKSFINLSPKEKRDIIDKLFGYHVINIASTKVKEKLKTVKNDILQCESTISGYEASINEIESNIKKINSEESDTNDYTDELNLITENLNLKTVEYKKIVPKLNCENEKLDELKSTKIKLSGLESNVQSQLDLYNKGICPTCGSRLDDDEHLNTRNDLLEKQSKINDKKQILETKLNKVKNSIQKITDQKDVLTNEINNLKLRQTKLETTIKEQKKATGDQISNLKEMQSSIEQKIIPKKEELSKHEKTSKVLGIVSEIFSENGLKQYISNIYVPLINEYVSETCNELGIPYRVMFTQGYESVITFMGEEINYSTMSTGERKKVDIAVTLAFLKIIKTKIADINILFLDEVLSSIDVESCNNLLKIFSDFSKNNKLRIYMVHHANLDSTYIDNIISVEKQSGFSHFV